MNLSLQAASMVFQTFKNEKKKKIEEKPQLASSFDGFAKWSGCWLAVEYVAYEGVLKNRYQTNTKKIFENI